MTWFLVEVSSAHGGPWHAFVEADNEEYAYDIGRQWAEKAKPTATPFPLSESALRALPRLTQTNVQILLAWSPLPTSSFEVSP